MLSQEYVANIITLRFKLLAAAPQIKVWQHNGINLVHINNKLRRISGMDLGPFAWTPEGAAVNICDDINEIMYCSIALRRPIVQLETLIELVEPILQLKGVPAPRCCNRFRSRFCSFVEWFKN
jgi:hypothetical protein